MAMLYDLVPALLLAVQRALSTRQDDLPAADAAGIALLAGIAAGMTTAYSAAFDECTATRTDLRARAQHSVDTAMRAVRDGRLK